MHKDPHAQKSAAAMTRPMAERSQRPETVGGAADAAEGRVGVFRTADCDLDGDRRFFREDLALLIFTCPQRAAQIYAKWATVGARVY